MMMRLHLRGSHGFSAQRARKAKSRGPKGLLLEVGPQREPTLLVAKQILCMPPCAELEVATDQDNGDLRESQKLIVSDMKTGNGILMRGSLLSTENLLKK